LGAEKTHKGVERCEDYKDSNVTTWHIYDQRFQETWNIWRIESHANCYNTRYIVMLRSHQLCNTRCQIVCAAIRVTTYAVKYKDYNVIE